MEKTNLIKIPYVGKNTREDLINIGIRCVEDLKGKDPEKLYEMDCKFKGYQEDRCQLYVFRMAVKYAETESGNPEKEKLRWWDFKDKN